MNTTQQYGLLRKVSRSVGMLLVVVLLATLTPVVTAEPAAADKTSAVTDKSVAALTSSWSLHTDVTASYINNQINAFSKRILEIQVATESPLTFNVRLIGNSGAYTAPGGGWAWYYDKTRTELNTLAANSDARIIDADGYSTSSGTRYVAVMVGNSGAAYRKWIWRVNPNPTTIYNEMWNSAWRPISQDNFVSSGKKYWVVAAVKNTGADAKGWGWAIDRTVANLNSAVGSNRLIDVQRNGTRYDGIFYNEPLGFSQWSDSFVSRAAVIEFARQTGTRPISIDRYTVNGFVRYVAVFLNNVNALTASIRDKYWSVAQGRGSWGWTLKQVNGPTLTALQDTKQFEPASTIKVLYHLHAIKQRQAGFVTDGSGATFRYKSTPANHTDANGEGHICPDAHSNTATTTLRNADEQMMWQSDNRMTRAITDKFGYGAIAGTASAAGLTQTDINHNIGCPPPRNLTTTRDVNRIYEDVYEDFNMLNNTHRLAFRERMGNDANGGFHWGSDSSTTDGFCPVVRQEAATIGVSQETADAFCYVTQWVGKGGSYVFLSTNANYPRTVSYSRGTLTSLPFKQDGALAVRRYAYSDFIDQATFNSSSVENSINSVRQQAYYDALRPQIRAGLRTW